MFLTLLKSSGAGPATITGNLAATETGADTFAATGSATGQITGAFAATETGSDSFAASGSVTGITPEPIKQTSGGPPKRRYFDPFENQKSEKADNRREIAGTVHASEQGADEFAADGEIFFPVISGIASSKESSKDGIQAFGTITTRLSSGLLLSAGVTPRRRRVDLIRSRPAI